MKKLFNDLMAARLVTFVILLLSVVAIFTSCSKNVEQRAYEAPATAGKPSVARPAVNETGGVKPLRTIATIGKKGDRRSGGIGWYLQVNPFEWEVPTFLPFQFQKAKLVVEVVYKRSKDPVPNYIGLTPKYMITIVSIAYAISETPMNTRSN